MAACHRPHVLLQSNGDIINLDAVLYRVVVRAYHADGLPSMHDGQPCSPYVRVECLDSSVHGDNPEVKAAHKSRRSSAKLQHFETKSVDKTSQPQWFVGEEDPAKYQVRCTPSASARSESSIQADVTTELSMCAAAAAVAPAMVGWLSGFRAAGLAAHLQGVQNHVCHQGLLLRSPQQVP